MSLYQQRHPEDSIIYVNGVTRNPAGVMVFHLNKTSSSRLVKQAYLLTGNTGSFTMRLHTPYYAGEVTIERW